MTTNVGQAELEVVPAARGFGRQLEGQLNGELPGAADRAGRRSGARFSSGFGAALKRGGALVGLGSIGLATVGIVKNAVTLEASFSKTMAQIGASTEGAAGHVDELNKLAMKLGAETSFSASDAAGAMLELGKAGINASDIMGGALSGTLTLAAAGSLDLGTASTIASNAMNTFNLRGKDMASIAAALAGGANASTASVESLGQALSQVGPGATNAGLSLQETVGVLSAFDQAGIKGSDAGTSLKTMLARLVPQTDAASSAMRKYNLDFTDAQGNFVSITNIADQLRKGLGGLSEAQRVSALTTIFGSDATRAATVLMKEGAAGVAEYVEATKDQAAAEKLAKVNTSGTAGALEKLKGSIETAELALGQALAPTIEDVANFLSEDAVPAVTGFIQGMQDGTGAGGDFADVLGDMVDVGKAVVGFIDGLPGPVKKFGAEGLIALLVLNKLNAAFTRVGASSIGTFVTGMRNAETRMQTTQRAAAGLGRGLAQVGGAAGMLLLADSTHQANQSLGFFEKAAGGALLGLAVGGPVGAAVGLAAGAVTGFATATHKAAVETVTAADATRHYVEALRGLSNIRSEEARAEALETINKKYKDFLGFTDKLNISQRDLVGVVTGEEGARKRVATIAARAAKSQNEATAAAGNGTKVLLDFLDGERSRLVGVTQANHEHNQTVATLKNLISQLPKEVQTAIKQPGAVKSIADIRELAKRYKLTPDQVQTLIEATNVPATVSDIQGVIDKAKEYGRQHPNPTIDANTGPARAKLSSLYRFLQGVVTGFGSINAGQVPGPSLPAGATGAIVRRPTLALIAESGPEALVPLNRTAGNSPLPTMSSSGGSADRFVLVLDDGTALGGYIDRRADARVGAASGMGGMTRRAGGR